MQTSHDGGVIFISQKGGLCMAHWTATQATASLVSLLGAARLILVSNREPYSHRLHRQVLTASRWQHAGVSWLTT